MFTGSVPADNSRKAPASDLTVRARRAIRRKLAAAEPLAEFYRRLAAARAAA